MSASDSFLCDFRYMRGPQRDLQKWNPWIQGLCWTLWPLWSVNTLPPTTHPPNNVVPQCAKSHLSNLQGYKLVCFMFKLHIYTQHQSWQTPPSRILSSPDGRGMTAGRALLPERDVSAVCTPVWRRRGRGVGGRLLTSSDSPPPLRQHQCLPVPCCSDARHAAGRTEGSPDYGRAGCPPPNALQPPPPPGPSYHNYHSTRAGETSQRRRVCVCSFSQLTVLLQKRCQSTVNTVKDSVISAF